MRTALTAIIDRMSQASAPKPHQPVITMTKADVIRQAIRDSGSRILSVRFVKKNGEERTLPFNPLHIGEVKGTGNPLKDKEAIENIFKVMDLSHNPPAWRCFDARRVLYVRVNGKRIDLS